MSSWGFSFEGSFGCLFYVCFSDEGGNLPRFLESFVRFFVGFSQVILGSIEIN